MYVYMDLCYQQKMSLRTIVCKIMQIFNIEIVVNPDYCLLVRGAFKLSEVSLNRGFCTVPDRNWDFFSCSSSLLQTKCHALMLMLQY